ncbi:11158_t:CDS:2 [Entrophospora sp. SA101]|nr:11158_t:CDS:2 [Entrophospora sp. SA101]
MSDPVSNNTADVTFAVTPEEGQVVLTLLLIQSTASLIATVLGISVFFSIRHKYPRLVNRVTFRLALATMISDFGISVAQLIGATLASPTGPSCIIAIWGTVFFSLMSIFLPTCIAINLQIMFIHGYRGRLKLEMFYFIISIALASILSLAPFADNMYGWDVPEATCWYRDSGTKLSITWQWASFYTWEIICILYCIITLICIGVKLHKVSSQSISTNNIDGQTMTSQYDKNVLRNKTIISLVVGKVVWYPVVPIITQGPNFLFETDIYVNQKVNFVFSILATLLSFQVFMQDIAVSRAYRLTKLNWWYNHVNKYEESYPHLSRNKALDPLESVDRVDHELKDKNQKQSQQQPSVAEKLRYNLLTLLFSKPKGDEMLTEYDQYMTVKDDEELLSTTQTMNDKNDGDAKKMSDTVSNDTETVTFAVTDEQGKAALLLMLIEIDRVTFRLALGTIVSDFGIAGAKLIGSMFTSQTGPACTIAIWGTNQTVNANISGQTATSKHDKNVLRNKAIISLVVKKVNESYHHLSRNKALGSADHEVKDEQQKQSQQQPSFGEKLRYNLLILLISKSKGDEILIEYDQFMTVKDDEELLSTTQTMNDKNDGDAKVKDDEGTLDQFNKNVLCKM